MKNDLKLHLLLSAFLILTSLPVHGETTFTESFGNGTMDRHLSVLDPLGFSVTLTGGVALFAKTEGPTTGFIDIVTCFLVAGDFTATIDADRQNLGTASLGIFVEPDPPAEGKFADIYFIGPGLIQANIFIGQGFGSRLATDSNLSARFRIRRIGETLLLDYDTGGGYVTLHYATNPSLAVPLRVLLFLGQEDPNVAACSGSFDNFAITTGSFVGCDLDEDGVDFGSDCDDLDSCAFPSAPEICDGKDNDCDFVVDEGPLSIPGPTRGLRLHSDKTTVQWTACGGSTYDVVRGDLVLLRSSAGDFTTSLVDCVENESTDLSSSDPNQPTVGGAFYYLVRTSSVCGSGTYDSGSPSEVGSRDAEIAASPGACP
jgi:hypothetical protein